MKMKKVGRLLSLVVAGAMALSMIPAAFAADAVTYHTEYVPETNTTHAIYRHFTDGTDMYVGSADCYWVNGQCKDCKQDCDHMGTEFDISANNDGTHNVLCHRCGETVSENVPCDYVDGKCQQCGATCNHMANSWEYEGTDHGTHKVICKVCKAVVDELGCLYVNGKCKTCGAPEPACQHLNENYKYVANNNGTHDVVCTDCGAVAKENVPCDYVDGKCQLCGATCDHRADSWKYESTDHGTHKVICAVCGKTVDELGCLYVNGKCKTCGAKEPTEKPCEHVNQRGVDNGDGTCSYVCLDCNAVIDTQAHVYYNGETSCARCGAPCSHNAGEEYESTGYGTHKVLCKDCKKVMDELGCVYVNGECQKCGAKEPTEKPCEHVNQRGVDNGDGTCSYVCLDCNAVIDTVAHIYYDGEDTCARCGAAKAVCKHLNENYEYVDNGNGTHNVVCADCGAVAQKNVACTYILDECVHCGGLYDVASNVPFPISIGKGLLRSLRSFFMSIFIR